MARFRPPVLAQLTFRENEAALRDLDLAARFRFIHRTNMWGSPQTTSGVGSTFDATAAIRRGIMEICREYKIDILLDAPCGDCSWITPVDLPVQRYIGVDIVPELIEQNRQNYDNRNCEFLMADLTSEQLPGCHLVLCRDCLVHLSFDNIRLALATIRNSGARYLLTTTFPEHDLNEDIADGDWRLLNLEKAPFFFPSPLLTINEQCREIGGAYRDKSLALWEVAALPV